LPGGPLCIVEFDYFARFAELWLTGEDAAVNFVDVQVFGDYWLQHSPRSWRLR
jgi:hypothetical protein